MDNSISNLEKSCEDLLPKIRKKGESDNIINFRRENEKIFYNSLSQRKLNQKSPIFLFIKEFSSLLLYFVITGNEYNGKAKEDLEYLYNNYLKNLKFGGRYIVDSYIKIFNFNNTIQLKQDQFYIAENIQKAKNFDVNNQTISSLCKEYISKCIIYSIFDNLNECVLLKFLTDDDKKYFNLMIKSSSEENKAFVDNKDNKSIKNKSNETLTTEPENDENNKKLNPSSIGGNVKENNNKPKEDIETIAKKESNDIIPDKKEKNGIKIVIISSDTQMNQVRLAFSQDWLDNNEKLFNWPYHVNFKKDITILDGWVDAPKTSIKTIAEYDLIIIGQNDHMLKDMPPEYSSGGKKDGGIQKCLLDLYNIGYGHVYFPKQHNRPDFSVTNLRNSLNDFMRIQSLKIPTIE